MPEKYKADYPSTFAIFDCTELRVERLTSLVLQSQSFSNYKSTNTLKSVVVCDPRGAVIFHHLAPMSDKEIVRQCGILPLLENLIKVGYLKKGDDIMADKGFLIEEEINAIGLELNLLQDPKGKCQLAMCL